MTSPPLIKPIPDCPHCRGLGSVPRSADDPGSRRMECECVLLQKVRAYLGPYVEGPWKKDFDPAPWVGRNVICENVREAPFKAFVKSFLLNSYQPGHPLAHLTVAPFAVVDAYYAHSATHKFLAKDSGDHSEEGRSSESFGQLRRIELVILRLLGTDPKHGQYADVLTTLIQERQLHRRVTWIYSKFPLSSAIFGEVYGYPFASFLQSPDFTYRKVT